MVPLFIGEFFRRRKRRRYANDDLPFAPMLDIVWFWMLLVFGALFADIAILAAGASWLAGVTWDRTTVILLILAAIASPVCLWFAMVFWWRMTR
jgi:hypothetical protein